MSFQQIIQELETTEGYISISLKNGQSFIVSFKEDLPEFKESFVFANVMGKRSSAGGGFLNETKIVFKLEEIASIETIDVR